MRWDRLARLRSGALRLAPILAGVIFAGGCARERPAITPSTLGTDLRRAPRGTMTPFPWPGSDLSKGTPGPRSPTADPEAARASGSAESR